VNPRATDNLKESAIGSTQLNEYSSDIRKIPEIKYVNFFLKGNPNILHKQKHPTQRTILFGFFSFSKCAIQPARIGTMAKNARTFTFLFVSSLSEQLNSQSNTQESDEDST
jgi:hypothetical protein